MVDTEREAEEPKRKKKQWIKPTRPQVYVVYCELWYIVYTHSISNSGVEVKK